MRLIAERQQSTVFSKINLNGMLRADPKARGEYYKSMINAGVMSINEIRELEELNSIGSDGDEHYLQINMAPLSMIREIAEKASKPDPAPSNPAPAPADDSDNAPSAILKLKRN